MALCIFIWCSRRFHFDAVRVFSIFVCFVFLGFFLCLFKIKTVVPSKTVKYEFLLILMLCWSIQYMFVEMQCSITFYVNKLISFRKRYLYVHKILNAKWYLPLRSENKRVLLIKSPEMVKKILKTCFFMLWYIQKFVWLWIYFFSDLAI